MEQPNFKRTIKSFVLRQGHLSASQSRAIQQLMPHWGIEYNNQLMDLDTLFSRKAPVILEIGFGMGTTSAEIAAQNPQNNYLGIEVHSPGVGNLLKLIDEQKLTNLRIIHHDAVEVLEQMLEDETLDGIHIFFPDPWQKKRHNKRRLIQPMFVEQLCKKLKPEGYLHCATDWKEYAQHILKVLSSSNELKNTAETYTTRPDYRPLTKFEARGLRLGHEVWDIIFVKKINLAK